MSDNTPTPSVPQNNTPPPGHVPAYADDSLPLDQRIEAADQAMRIGDTAGAAWANHLKMRYASAMGVVQTQATPTDLTGAGERPVPSDVQPGDEAAQQETMDQIRERIQNRGQELGVTGQVMGDITDQGRANRFAERNIDLSDPQPHGEGQGRGEGAGESGSSGPTPQPDPNDPMDATRQQFARHQQRDAEAEQRRSSATRASRAEAEGRWGDAFDLKMQQAHRDADGR